MCVCEKERGGKSEEERENICVFECESERLCVCPKERQRVCECGREIELATTYGPSS